MARYSCALLTLWIKPFKFNCSVRVTRCMCASVPVHGFCIVLRNTPTALVTESDLEQCIRVSLGASKLVPPQRLSFVKSNTPAIAIHVAHHALCHIKALLSSLLIKRNRLCVIHRKSFCTAKMKPADRELAVSAAQP